MGLFTDAAPRVTSPLLRLAPGQTIAPAEGWYFFGGYTNVNVQRYDPVTQIWRWSGDNTDATTFMFFDGQLTRIANTTGCAVAAAVTTVGSGYTSAPVVTASAGNSIWRAIVGGAISTSVTINSAGNGYSYPPVIWIDQPPTGGVQATGYATITNGSITAVTIDNQGAGYTSPPNVAILTDWRDTTGSGGQVTLALTGNGTITAVVCTNHGSPITSGTVPTLSFGSGSAAATAIMDWAIVSASATTAGAGYTAAASFVTASGAGGTVNPSLTYAGTGTGSDMTRWKAANLTVTTTAAGGLSTIQIIDGGRYQAIPAPVISAAQSPATVGALSFVMGGQAATAYLMPASQQ